MVIVNRLYKRSAGLLSCCLICLLMMGCGGKSDSPDKGKSEQAQEIARQKIPGAETKPDVTPDTQQKKAPTPGNAVKASEPVKTATPPATVSHQPVADKGSPASTSMAQNKPAAPAGTQGTASGEDAVKPLSPEKQAEIEAITKEAKTAAKVEAATKQVEQLVAEKQKQTSSETDLVPGEGTAPEAAPVIDLGKETAETETGTGEGDEEAEKDEFFNPFAPLFQKEDTGVSMAEPPSFRDKRGEFLTPLEKIDIGQLTLKGVIQAQSGNRAIVVDASGEGYVITMGTYVGLNSGTVEKIESDRIVIVESIGTRQSQTVLKLQKPAGE
jgi:hypothetical protein